MLFAGRAAPMHLLGLAPDGVYLATNITARAGGLLHHPFTLTPLPRRYTLCCTVPSGFPAWLLASIMPYGVRTFLSLHKANRDRLADLER